MTDTSTHLAEDERHGLADGTLPPEQLVRAREHLRTCDACAADVGRISSLMTRVKGSPMPAAEVDDLWPAIRSRIEQAKVVTMPGNAAMATPRQRRRLLIWLVPAIAAAAILAFVGTVKSRNVPGMDSPAPMSDRSNVSLVAVVDSAHAYEAEAQALLNKLELQRALLRPETRVALDRDLRVVDVAIAELKDAIARDPNNPALRQLLASSFKQKVDLLKRVGNAS
jgi:hypothetical protein